MPEERGRDIEADKKNLRARSRSRVRRVRNGEEKPLGARLKKIMKGMGSRKGPKSVGDTSSVASAAASTKSTPTKAEIAATTQPEAETTSLQLVLLLMDPSTRRFELLQLEFDSVRARVVDIIAQIPFSVTEEAIRGQEYVGVINEEGKLMDSTVRLVDFCKEKQVLVALPKGLPVKECSRLARPILSDGQVLKMLTNGGFDVSKWKKKEAPADSKTSEESKSRQLSVPLAAVSEKDIDLSGSSAESRVNAFTIIAFFAILAIILIQATHNYITAPIRVGVPLPPGTRRSKCGLGGYLPTKFSFACTDSYLEVNEDGTVSVFGEDRELDMLLVGDTCSKEDCVDGILMEADGTVYVGGKRIKSLLVYGGDSTVTPWPFEESPKLKIKKYTLNK